MLDSRRASGPIRGRISPPGDKSISHRALILSALAEGSSLISGLLHSEDVLATRAALEQLGAGFTQQGGGLKVDGLGEQGLKAPKCDLDMGNSGTAMRLLAGVLAGQRFDSRLKGDESLSRRPMRRIFTPLRRMGASIRGSAHDTAPLVIRGRPLSGIDYVSPVASAQVKSCVLLAGLYAAGRTSVTEPETSRDHTERMLPVFGVELDEPPALIGGSRLKAAEITIPGDISSAAFLIAAALQVKGSELLLNNVGLNPTRDGLLRVLKAMGGEIRQNLDPAPGYEPAGDIEVRYSGRLKAIDVPAEWIPSMVDEVPVVMAIAALAAGKTRIRGASELRVKESDRLSVMSKGLRKLGVRVDEFEDGVDITGTAAIEGAIVDSAGDHRCAMSFAVLGQSVPAGVRIQGAEYIGTSYPGFMDDMTALGASIRMPEAR